MTETKPGLKTSEAWGSGAVVATGIAMASGQLPVTKEAVLALGVAAASAGIYAISRSLVKRSRGTPQG